MQFFLLVVPVFSGLSDISQRRCDSGAACADSTSCASRTSGPSSYAQNGETVMKGSDSAQRSNKHAVKDKIFPKISRQTKGENESLRDTRSSTNPAADNRTDPLSHLKKPCIHQSSAANIRKSGMDPEEPPTTYVQREYSGLSFEPEVHSEFAEQTGLSEKYLWEQYEIEEKERQNPVLEHRGLFVVLTIKRDCKRKVKAGSEKPAQKKPRSSFVPNVNSSYSRSETVTSSAFRELARSSTKDASVGNGRRAGNGRNCKRKSPHDSFRHDYDDDRKQETGYDSSATITKLDPSFGEINGSLRHEPISYNSGQKDGMDGTLGRSLITADSNNRETKQEVNVFTTFDLYRHDKKLMARSDAYNVNVRRSILYMGILARYDNPGEYIKAVDSSVIDKILRKDYLKILGCFMPRVMNMTVKEDVKVKNVVYEEGVVHQERQTTVARRRQFGRRLPLISDFEVDTFFFETGCFLATLLSKDIPGNGDDDVRARHFYSFLRICFMRSGVRKIVFIFAARTMELYLKDDQIGSDILILAPNTDSDEILKGAEFARLISILRPKTIVYAMSHKISLSDSNPDRKEEHLYNAFSNLFHGFLGDIIRTLTSEHPTKSSLETSSHDKTLRAELAKVQKFVFFFSDDNTVQTLEKLLSQTQSSRSESSASSGGVYFTLKNQACESGNGLLDQLRDLVITKERIEISSTNRFFANHGIIIRLLSKFVISYMPKEAVDVSGQLHSATEEQDC